VAKRNRHQHEKKALVDICLITAGRFDLLRRCIDSVKAQTFTDYTVHLFDNGSPIEEKTANLGLFSEFDTKRSQQNTGYPRGMNECARMGTAPLILFLTDDVELFPDTLETLVKRMDDNSIGMCGLKLLFPKDVPSPNGPAGKVQHIGLAMDVKASVQHPLIGWSADNPKTCVSQDVFGVTGATFMIRRKIFNEAGGFFEGYGLGTYEDIDLSLSVRALKHRVFIDTDAKAYHRVGATSEKLNVGFPLGMNSMIFRARWGNSGLFTWDDWEYY